MPRKSPKTGHSDDTVTDEEFEATIGPKRELLYDAQEKMHEAIEMITEAVEGTRMERSAHAYILAHLENWANGNNPYDETIPKLIEQLEEE